MRLITGARQPGGTNAVFQIMGPLYAYYSSVGANTAGYPLGDSQSCSAQGVSCVWDTFDKNYALFAYVTAIAQRDRTSASTARSLPSGRRWAGSPTFGSPVSAQTAITAAIIAPATAGTTATVQTYRQGRDLLDHVGDEPRTRSSA